MLFDDLNHQQHEISYSEDGWSSRHPLIERANGTLFGCKTAAMAIEYAQEIGLPYGRYIVTAIPHIAGIQDGDFDFSYSDADA